MAGPSDPYEIGRSLGIKDPATLDRWVQEHAPGYTPPAQAAPEIDPDSPEAWQQAAAEAGAPGAVRMPSQDSPNPYADSNTPGAEERALRERAENEERKKRAQGMENYLGISPEDARQRAGVKTMPGDIGPPDDPRKGATPLEPDNQWLPKSAAGGAPVMVSPGGRRTHSWTVQEGLNLPATAAAYGEVNRTSREAAEAGRDAGVAEAEREVAYLQHHEQLQERRALELKWKAEDRARRLQAETDKLAEMVDAVKSDKIDERAFFTKKGTAGGIAAAIGYMLGAVGGALTHTENPVVGMIRDEIQAQKDNAALRKQAIGEQKGLLGQLTKTFDDENIGEHAAWVAYLEKAKTQMSRIAADSKSDWVAAKYKQAIASINAELAPHVQQLEMLMQDKVARQDVNAPPTFIGGGGGAKSDPADPLFVPTGPHGEGFKARSEKEAQAARGVIQAEQDIVPMLERLKELRSKTNWAERRYAGIYESGDVAEIKSLQAQVALKLRELSTTSPGAMDKGMQDLAAQIQGDWTATQGNPDRAADAFITNIRRQKDSMMRGQGAQAQRQGLTFDQRGNVVTRSQGQPKFAAPKPETPKSFKRAE